MSKNVIIAIVLFVLIVGGIAWVVQYLPAWRAGTSTPAPPPSKVKDEDDLLTFSRRRVQLGALRAVIATFELNENGKDTGYVLEFLRGGHGHYDFAFRNVSDGVVEIELAKTACDCSNAEICLLDPAEWNTVNELLTKTPWAEPKLVKEPAWHKFTMNPEVGFKIPAGGQGLLRITWVGRKLPGEMLNIHLTFWEQSEGDKSSRRHDAIIVPVAITQMVWFDPPKKEFVMLAPGEQQTVEFSAWSPILDSFDKISLEGREPNPLVKVEVEPFTPAECKELEKEMRAKAKAPRFRVRCAAHVHVTLLERSGDRQMDLGHFSLPIPVHVEGAVVDHATPTISGFVRGEIDVGGQNDQGKIQLKTFSTAEDKVEVVSIHANPKFKLEYVEHTPKDLKVKLTPNPTGSTPTRAAWNLEVTVPAGTRTGPLPEDARITLRIAADPPRLIRIPVLGIVTR